ncbi:hypothetical protein V1477_011978 [Vespula maculifrons]|uniref:Uncharacterized protein n=1 Tax=Vespula maculifrons TaxID=7453 RepID=A0ABD2C0V6_VESMC
MPRHLVLVQEIRIDSKTRGVKNKKEEDPNRERSLFFVRPLQRFIRPRLKPDRTSMLIVVLVVAEKPKSACIRRLEPKSPIPRKSFVPPHRIFRHLIGRDVGPEFNYPKQVDEGNGLLRMTMTEKTDGMTRKPKGKEIRSLIYRFPLRRRPFTAMKATKTREKREEFR